MNKQIKINLWISSFLAGSLSYWYRSCWLPASNHGMFLIRWRATFLQPIRWRATCTSLQLLDLRQCGIVRRRWRLFLIRWHTYIFLLLADLWMIRRLTHMCVCNIHCIFRYMNFLQGFLAFTQTLSRILYFGIITIDSRVFEFWCQLEARPESLYCSISSSEIVISEIIISHKIQPLAWPLGMQSDTKFPVFL